MHHKLLASTHNNVPHSHCCAQKILTSIPNFFHSALKIDSYLVISDIGTVVDHPNYRVPVQNSTEVVCIQLLWIFVTDFLIIIITTQLLLPVGLTVVRQYQSYVCPSAVSLYKCVVCYLCVMLFSDSNEECAIRNIMIFLLDYQPRRSRSSICCGRLRWSQQPNSFSGLFVCLWCVAILWWFAHYPILRIPMIVFSNFSLELLAHNQPSQLPLPLLPPLPSTMVCIIIIIQLEKSSCFICLLGRIWIFRLDPSFGSAANTP